MTVKALEWSVAK